ncbi:MAG TPA: class I SAM-dependent methyltransferase, partial [Aggregatilineaceae bacterium]|nr:class I SAM-dependent methyltransferase [Aggregatilineaceae bacterium]
HFTPSKIIELGSGFSTLVTAQAAKLKGCTEMVAIEPYPSDILKQGVPGLSKLIPARAQEIELDYFDQLGPNDILFVDTVHAVKTGGDVNYLFLEVFPRLRPGVIVHIHDIFLPYEYPKIWLRTRKVFWSEQYLLHAFLICNREFEVLFGSHYMTSKYQELARATFPEVPNGWQGGSFWMRRKLEEPNAEDRHN